MTTPATKSDLKALEKRLITAVALGAALGSINGARVEEIIALTELYEELIERFAALPKAKRHDWLWDTLTGMQALKGDDSDGGSHG